jgi:uncharacterized caspase-like protein
MVRHLARLLLVLSAILLAAPTLAETRVALVIGNSAYKHAPALANPKNDAEGVAASLKRLKFDVLLGVDLDEAGMRRLLRDFAGKVEGLGKDDVALVFYAGHGLQVSGSNYLVPVDAKLEKESDLAFQAVSLDFLSKLLEQTPHTNIVILDSCRDNPLARTLARGMGTRSTGIGRGLAEMRGVNDTLIVYATNPGNVALDGDTKHSPFTEALLKHIERPGLEVRHMVGEVRAAVIAATKGKQVPWESASLTRQIYFAPAASPGATPAAPTPAPARPSTPDNEALFWQSIKDSKNAADFKDYLARWPSGTFADLAKRRIAELEKAADVTPPAPEKKSEQPATPVRPQRTSTFETGVRLDGNILPVRPNVTAQRCQALCLANLQCVAWQWYQAMADEPNTTPGVCTPFRSFLQRIPYTAGRLYISGIIRTTPAAAPAQPAAPKPPATDQQAPVRELMRKAQAGERVTDYCDAFPGRAIINGAALRGAVGFNELPRGASTLAYKDVYNGVAHWCGILQASADFKGSPFDRCKRVKVWACPRHGTCRAEAYVACEQPHDSRAAWTILRMGQ